MSETSIPMLFRTVELLYKQLTDQTNGKLAKTVWRGSSHVVTEESRAERRPLSTEMSVPGAGPCQAVRGADWSGEAEQAAVG